MFLKTLFPLGMSALAAAALASGSATARADAGDVAAPPADRTLSTAECIRESNASLVSTSANRLVAARAQLLVCAAASCPAEIRDECVRRVGEVNAAMPTVVFEARDASGNDVSAATVTMDGARLVDRLDGRALSIDPGDHAFLFEAPGQQPVRKHLVIREGEKNRLARIDFVPIEPARSPPAPETVPNAAMSPVPEPRARSSRRIVGLVLGGAGFVGASVGITLLAFASNMSNRSADESAAWPALAQNDRDAARADEIVGLVLGGAGIAALAVATYLVLTGQPSRWVASSGLVGMRF